MPYFYVYDWFAESWEEFKSLFMEIFRRAVRDEAKTLQAYGQTAEEENWLRRAGYFLMRTPCQILCYPPDRLIHQFARMRYSIFDSDGNL